MALIRRNTAPGQLVDKTPLIVFCGLETGLCLACVYKYQLFVLGKHPFHSRQYNYFRNSLCQ